MTLVEKLTALRREMQAQQLDYYYVPSSDAHQGEYVPEAWERRRWISGFTGSAGDVIVGLEQAYLWTDGRYTLQASKELDPAYFTLVSQQQGVSAPIDQWLSDLRRPVRLGVDPKVLTVGQFNRLQAALVKHGGCCVSIDTNLVDAIWIDQPALVAEPLLIHEERYAGESVTGKLQRVRAAMAAKGAAAHALSGLDAIAWLFNIRGHDIDYNPLVLSYALITTTQAILCVSLSKVSAANRAVLAQQGVTLADYEAFATLLQQQEGVVWFDPALASRWMVQQVAEKQQLLAESPVTLMKACKNPVEIDGSRLAHRRDGVALVRFLHWLETHWREGVDELTVADKLIEFRRQGEHYRGASFATIAGFGPNGAVIHYHATPATNRTIDDTDILLLDSGAQYDEGTTDITRMIHLGQPSAEQKRHYTLVLKGHLALRHQQFVAGSVGAHLDAFARAPLWQAGLDYAHGTGHGVGSYLCVHEGPQRISPALINAPLLPGMIVSNEPGVYFPGQYGIRIENLCVVKEVISKESSAVKRAFYQLDDLTMVPHCRQLVDVALLTVDERKQLNAYHQQVEQVLLPLLDKPLQVWLKAQTAAM